MNASSLSETDPRLLDALASLNAIGAALNQIGADSAAGIAPTLSMIAESAVRVVPGASAVIYSYDPGSQSFDAGSRVASGDIGVGLDDLPRPDGFGQRALRARRRLLSYEETGLPIHPARAKAGAKTLACFPLIVASAPVGVLFIYLREVRPFSRLELLMLENFVNLAATAMHHAHNLARIQRDLARKEDELLRLRRAGLLISSRLGLADTLKAILHMALDVTGAQYGIFRLLDRDGQSLVTRAIAGEHLARPLAEAIPVESDSIMALAARTRLPVCVTDLQEDRWKSIYVPLDAELTMRSELAVPLIGANGRLEGVLNLESPVVGEFGEDDSHLLQALATQAVIAIQEARLLDALQEAARLLLNHPCQVVLNRLTELACDLLDAPASAVWKLEDTHLLREAASGPQDLLPRLSLDSGHILTEAIRARAILTRAATVAVPLLPGPGSVPLGVFAVYGKTDLSEWDKKVLAFLTDYAVMAYQNAARQDALLTAQEQRAMAETFAAVGDVTSNLLHRINNKVGTIPVRIQGIQDKCADAVAASPYLARNLQEIERTAAEAMQSVHDSLSHLRPIRIEPVNIAPRVEDAIRAAGLPEGVVVSTAGLHNLPLVRAGGSTLTLVFTNLLENAAVALNGHGRVTISGQAAADWVEIIVRDDGPGISPLLHDHIFELNFSGRGASRPGKLGFGLWWVKTLMTRLGGSVTVESDGQHGTAFRLRLPRHKGTA